MKFVTFQCKTSPLSVGPANAQKAAPAAVPGAPSITTTTIHPIQPHAHTGRSVTPPSSGSEMKNADDVSKDIPIPVPFSNNEKKLKEQTFYFDFDMEINHF